ncbi:exodeoxyribonuclease V subunit alpha [Desulfurivibrio alkaliphilus]|uniref:Exodeoxyribonuclease V, alpha subunit n=1 Tax=Desulfurivibrio alkaliphilus (strain DSM 19089 / UNIQEM U267 / AHT2) TaxID=589865 RepID=D6Z1G4_DESAT|nr:exodeoxyribonuclease V subunit alpha [Desulfurivibrio alkaliphilus]ADH85419.1 exodeoxyribonuclease V, alpha subunit [Desulfurivibrio alkaliphilus AHT 2]
MGPEMAQLMERLVKEEVLAEFDRHWLELLARLQPQSSPALLLTAALLRRAVDLGHVCLKLPEVAAWWPAEAAAMGYAAPSPSTLLAELRHSALVDSLEPGACSHLQGATEHGPPQVAVAPLVLSDNRLYLRRYWQYEMALADEIRARAVRVPAPPAPEVAAARLAELATAAGVELDQDQQAAVLGALNHYLTVISGGPGTGKTTIIFFILTLLTQMAREEGQGSDLRVLLLAPTGKATARLAETLRERAAEFSAMTIHRALGYQSCSPTIFRHNRSNPLAADLVVVDEASMVDLALMSKLFAAVSPRARLVLLGDKDQLASVEAGSILGDICLAAPQLDSAVIELSREFRFDPRRGIGALVRGIKAGEPATVLAVPVRVDGAQNDDPKGPPAEVTLSDQPGAPAENPTLRELVLAGFRPCLQASSPAEALARMNDFRLLCAHRRGPYGVEQLNSFCRQLLRAEGVLGEAAGRGAMGKEARGPADGLAPEGDYYRGQPVLVVANSYESRLFNGDLGIIWPSPDDAGQLMAFFPSAQGAPRMLPPGRLPRHETAFAMTIHKSQGSEFNQVAVVLPPEDSPLLSRELLYTAVSRARSRVHLFGPEQVLSRAVDRRVTRASGLAEILTRTENGHISAPI